MYHWAVLLCVAFFINVCLGEVEEFVPTSEWAEIREGQSIPKGLHVRMNLQTGIKEAKILSKEDASSPETQHLVLRGENGTKLQTTEQALKNVVNSRDNTETVSQKFRSIDELKQSLEDVKLDFKTEAAVLQTKIAALTRLSKSDIPSLVILLEEIEDLAHKYDNGKLLASEGWMSGVGALLSHDHQEVYKAALRVLGAAAQSNPSVQAYCIQKGYLGSLISKIMMQSDKLAKSTIFAISSIVRGLPAGVNAFANLQGFGTLTTKLNLSDFAPLHKVILALYNDLFAIDQQLKEDNILRHMTVVSKILCKKTTSLILKPDTDVDILEESVVLYSHIQSLCSTEQTQEVKSKAGNYAANNPDSNIIHVIKNSLS